MANKENKMLDELRRRGTIFEDPCPKSEGFIGKLIDLFSKNKSWFVKELDEAEAGNLRYCQLN